MRRASRRAEAPGEPLKAIFFDMDGVLVDVSGSFHRVVEELVEAYTGQPLAPGTVQAWKDCGGYNNDWKLTQALLAERGLEPDYAEIVERFQLRYTGRGYDGLITTEPPLVETATLERLAERFGEMALVTGRPEADARWTLERFGWSAFFPVIVGMETQGERGKPDPYGLTLALQHLAERRPEPLQPAEVVYAGDTVDDIHAAKASGMVALGVVPPYLARSHRQTLEAAGADDVVDRTDDVLPWIIERAV